MDEVMRVRDGTLDHDVSGLWVGEDLGGVEEGLGVLRLVPLVGEVV